MQIGFDVSMKQTQKLVLTPQMEQSLQILQMSTDELNQCMEEEVLQNPILTFGETTRVYRKEENDEQSYMNAIPDEQSTEMSLDEYLRMQLCTRKLSEKRRKHCNFIIECLEDTGYLKFTSVEIANVLHVEQKEIEQEIKLLQTLEPAGVFAKDLKECLLIQMRQQNKSKQLFELAEHHLEDVANNRIPQISKQTGWKKEEVISLIEELKKLEPIPARGFGVVKKQEYIYPDLTVKESKDGFEIVLNKERVNTIQLNKEYLPLLKSNTDGKEGEYLKEQYQHAKMLIKNIAKREETIRAIAGVIVIQQQEFFEKGKLYLKPLNLSDIAWELDIHESTVSRAIKDKYLECKWGIFELKYFFSNKAPALENVHVCIENIIENENKKKPYSDAAIAEELEKMGIKISRRTVAKYREQLNIPKVSLRRSYN